MITQGRLTTAPEYLAAVLHYTIVCMRVTRGAGVETGACLRNRKLIIKLAVIVGVSLGALIIVPPLGLFLVFLIFVKTLRGERGEPIRSPMVSGSFEIVPSAVVAGSEPVPVKLVYRVGPGGITEGGSVRLCPGSVLRLRADAWQLRLQWANGWGTLQRRDPSKANYLEVRSSRPDVELSVSLMEKAMDRTQLRWLKRKFLQKIGRKLEQIDPRDVFLQNLKVTVRLERGSLDEGDTVEFSLGEGSGLRPPLGTMRTEFAIEVDSSANGDYWLDSAVPRLDAVGGAPAGIDVVAPTLAAPGETVRVLVRCLDSRGLLSPATGGKLLIQPEGNLEAPAEVVMPESGDGVARFQARVKGPGIARLHVRWSEQRLEGTSNPIVCSGAPGRLLWGDMHTHSLVSDGTQEPWYLYHRARDLMGRDFTAVSDHDNWSFGEERPRSPEELSLMMRLADDYCRTGEFVTFRTYEWTNNVFGHRNVLFGPDEMPIFLPMTNPDYSTPEGLLAALEGRDVMVVPHHTAWKTHAGEMHFDFGPRGHEKGAGLQRLVEVYSRHGNSEFYGCPRPISHVALVEGVRGTVMRAVLGKEYAGTKSRSYVRDALAAGHRFGLVAGSDEHIVGVDPRRAPSQLYSGGITGIFATAVTREAAWQSLKDRRVCGTTGARMLIEFRVNGVPHGAEMASDGEVHVTGHVVGTSGLELVELVKFDSKGYSAAWHGGGGGPEAVVDWKDPSFRENSFYYLRVIQDDGHMGWAGPTWVDYTPLGRL